MPVIRAGGCTSCRYFLAERGVLASGEVFRPMRILLFPPVEIPSPKPIFVWSRVE